MTRPSFGHREAKNLADTRTTALREHAVYVQRGGASRFRIGEDGRPVDRALAWVSYFTLVFTTIITLTPDSAAAAVLTVHTLVTTAIPV